MSELKDHNDLKKYLDELFPACAPHRLLVMSDQEFKEYERFRKKKRVNYK